MLKRINLLLCAFAIMFLAACAGSKGGTTESSGASGETVAGEPAPPKPDELKQAHTEAVSVTEENHDLAREAFELKNKMGLPTDE